jgi:two-component system nitrogen regulation sensor histidine kinase NtrY
MRLRFAVSGHAPAAIAKEPAAKTKQPGSGTAEPSETTNSEMKIEAATGN